MSELFLDGRLIGYESKPTDVNPDNVTLLFVHGTGGDKEDWRKQIDGIRIDGSVIALELPGHGASSPPGETSIAAYADWVERFVDVMRLKRVVLMGCSLGSAVAMWIATRQRTWLIALGLIGSGARLRVHPFILEGLINDPFTSLQKLAQYCLSNSSSDHLKALVVDKYSKSDPLIIHGDLTACDKFDIMNQLHEINVPTLIVVGEDDSLTPVKYSKYLNENIKLSKMVQIPAAGHLVMMEKPEEFNSAVQPFVNSL
ncbi:MAG: alpha/beta hydrolase [Pseudomonadota bacterium]